MNFTYTLLAAFLLLGNAQAQEICPGEAKLLVSSAAARPLITSMGFRHETNGHIYFFDTPSLDLLGAGIIVRIRQGAANDLTVKLRRPEGVRGDSNSALRSRFPCEIDRTRDRAETSYAVSRSYSAAQIPELGVDVQRLLSASQRNLLADAGVLIDWAPVVGIGHISSTRWRTRANSPHGKLALELWEWPGGKLLEISAKAAPGSVASKYDELAGLLMTTGVPLDPDQGTKTTTVLEALTHQAVPIRQPEQP